MATPAEFENSKREIRSILLTYQRGCYLSEFLKTYWSLVGQRFPSRRFGFQNDLEFLSNIPDVVKITPNAIGDPHLTGIADASTKHIQKLVGKQKSTKMKPPKPNFAKSNFYRVRPGYDMYTVPPRFSRKPEVSIIPSRPPPKIPNSSPVKYPSPPRVSDPPPVKYPSLPTLTPCEKLCAVIKDSEKGIHLVDVLPTYERMYKEKLCFEEYGFSSLEECIEDVNELGIVKWKNDFIVIYQTKHSHLYPESCHNKKPSEDEDPNYDEPDRIQSPCSMSSKEENNADNIYAKLRKVAERNPEGMLAADFPGIFEEVTLTTFNLERLGYNNLADLIDDVPDIFTRKMVTGSKRNWIIYPTDSPYLKMQDNSSNTSDNTPKEGVVLIDFIIMNIRVILEGCPEGIDLDDFLHVYCINIKDSLSIKELGFGSLENFLRTIKDKVPLYFEYDGNKKVVHLAKSGQKTNSFIDDFPSDVPSPNTQFIIQKLPSDMDLSQFFPIYTSSIAHPSHLYIQLQGDEYSVALGKLADQLEKFYNGPKSQEYLMKDVHIKAGMCCVALWPFDLQWYRAHIMSIQSMDSVQVEYIDYGTRDSVPKTMLRYIREEFMKLPAQAMKADLAFIKPPNNAPKWNVHVMRRLLSLCQDVSLMAKVEKVLPDGSYSLIVCNTNGDKDIYINDVLIEEGLAESIADPNSSVTEEVEQSALNSAQALQAHYCLQTLAAIAPNLAYNKHYLALLQLVSSHCFSPSPDMNVTKFLQTQQLAPVDSLIGQVDLQAKFSNEPSTTPLVSSYIENQNQEVFDGEDDDDLFNEFCSKVTLKSPRYVKRVYFNDGYKLHIIVVDRKPHASSGDIAQLLWENNTNNNLIRRLQVKGVDYKSTIVTEDDNPELFSQMQRYKVKGIEMSSLLKSSIVLFPLEEVSKVLRVFGHPSISLRVKLMAEINDFDPNNPEWQEFEPPTDITIVENVPQSVTDDDKIEKMCLYDLQAMEKGICCKIQNKRKMLVMSGNSVGCDEIAKLEQLLRRVQTRINEVQDICKIFD